MSERTYLDEMVSGWPVFFEAVEWGDIRTRLQAHLSAKLTQITKILPNVPIEKLKSVPIYIDLRTDVDPPIATYHPLDSKRWLTRNHEAVEKSGSINIRDASEFLLHVKGFYPDCLLHELAHAYHDKFLPNGFLNEDVLKEYRRSCPLWADKNQRLNCILDHKEYFANMTTAYYLRNSEIPYNRDELHHNDLGTHDLIPKLWGLI
jgi:hypothetical protein